MSAWQIEELGKRFQELESPLIAYAYSILGEREEAKDKVQEAFVRMIKEGKLIEKPKAWLYRTTRNLCISHIRKYHKIAMKGEEKQLDFFAGQMDESGHSNNPAEQLQNSEKLNRVVHFISLLPEDTQNLLELKFEKKLSYREISKQTGLSEGNIGYKLHHILRNLADELQAEGITS